ncbi:MAG: hypothetical protein P8X50_13960 [Maritimibacter sp.]|jgi:hypothetical protein
MDDLSNPESETDLPEGPVDAAELREAVRGSNNTLLISLFLIILVMFAGALGVVFLVNNIHAIAPN